MKIKIIKNRDITSLSMLFAVIIAIVMITSSSISNVFADSNSAVLFDGTNASATLPAANTTVGGVVLNLTGITEMQSITDGVEVDGVTYYQAIKTGGKSSSSRNIAITVPNTISKFTVTVVAAPNGTDAVKFSISTEKQTVETGDIIFLTTGTSSRNYTKATTDVQLVGNEATIFYLNFSASARIAYVEVTPVTDSTSSSSSAQNSGNSTYSGTSAKSSSTNKTVSSDEKHDILSIVQIGLVVVLIVLVAVGVVSIVRKNNKKNDFDWYDYDDYE